METTVQQPNPVVPTTSQQRWFFLKSGDAAPPVINGKRPAWTAMGDGYSYFITRDPSIATAIQTLVTKKVGGIESVDEADFYKKKQLSSMRQISIDERKASEVAWQSPGLQPQRQVDPLAHPLIQSSPPVAAPEPVVAPVAGDEFPGTIMRDPPLKNLLPLVPVKPLVIQAEPMPENPFL